MIKRVEREERKIEKVRERWNLTKNKVFEATQSYSGMTKFRVGNTANFKPIMPASPHY